MKLIKGALVEILSVLAIVCCLLFVYSKGQSDVLVSVKSNVIEGYHCAPITNHISLESAKAQVLAYQTMIRG